MADTVLPVAGAAPYDVVIGHHLAGRLPAMLGEHVRRVALLFPAGLEEQAQPVLDVLVPVLDVLALGLPEGEAAKTAAVAADCWEALGERGLTRSDAVVTVGGGATTDLGGFVAATWLRGVRVVHLPTTLLAMVDAAVGGKTGINTGAGKNLVGSFHEPAGVLCDLDHLATLPRADLVAGLAEVVKCGFVADPVILDLVESTDPASLTAGSPVLRELVERAIRVKIDVVVHDLREELATTDAPSSLGREVLNYGHTMAHAIERESSYAVRHGEAVALGCVFVAELAGRAGVLAPEVVERHRTTLARVGLPTTLSAVGAEASFEDLHAAMKVDKKARGDQLRFVVLDDIGRPRVLTDPPEADLRAAYAVLAGGAR